MLDTRFSVVAASILRHSSSHPDQDPGVLYSPSHTVRIQPKASDLLPIHHTYCYRMIFSSALRILLSICCAAASGFVDVMYQFSVTTTVFLQPDFEVLILFVPVETFSARLLDPPVCIAFREQLFIGSDVYDSNFLQHLLLSVFFVTLLQMPT